MIDFEEPEDPEEVARKAREAYLKRKAAILAKHAAKKKALEEAQTAKASPPAEPAPAPAKAEEKPATQSGEAASAVASAPPVAATSSTTATPPKAENAVKTPQPAVAADMFSDEFTAAVPVDSSATSRSLLHGGLFAERQEERIDHEGYFTERAGELINDGRFRVVRAVGKGVFSTVIVCDVVTPADRQVMGDRVAVKIIRGNEVM